jgi:hypothetical protein
MSRSAIDRAVTPSVKERPPVFGWSYVAFAVHSAHPGPVVLAIAHAEGRDCVLDVLRESITIEDSVPLLERYGITKVVGAPDEGDGDNLPHATAGAIGLAAGIAV